MNTKFAHICYYILSPMLASLAILSCNNQATTQELLDGNFLTKGLPDIDLLSPTDNQQLGSSPVFTWSARNVRLYNIQIATDSAFSKIILDKDVSANIYTFQSADLIGVNNLSTGSYYWRVKIPQVTNNLLSKAGTFFYVAIPANGSGYAGIIYVDRNSTTSVETGAKDAPYKSIQAAIAILDILRNRNKNVSFDVYVAKGTYTEEISLAAGISLRGGYDATSWSRDIVVNTTSIAAATDTAIRGNSTITATYQESTIVEGFSVQGGGLASNYAISLISSSPTIATNTITGGANAAGNTNYGIYISSSAAPLIRNNTITGGSTNNDYAVYCETNSSPVIQNNNITGGNGTNNYGVRCLNSSPSIIGNSISGGPNTIGMAILISGGAPTIANNLLLGGSGSSDSRGISLTGVSSAQVLNNTINCGTSACVVVYLSSIANTYIRNNIIFTTTGSGWCIYEDTGGSDPTEVRNNNLFGCATLYRDSANGNLSQICGPAGTGNTDSFDTTGGTCGAPTISGGTFSGNFSINNAGNQLFTNMNGPDGDILTLNDNDWHITTNPAICNVRGGGLNLSSNISTDKDGLSRTIAAISGCAPNNTGTTNWSIGAFESD